MAINLSRVKNIENRINIWEKPCGYNSKSKLEDMNIDCEANRFDVTVRYAKKINNEQFEDISRLGDTFTYLHEIKGGYELETYQDIPYLIPYKVENSNQAVIILSGGGFAYKTIDGSSSGGSRIAKLLNENGISAYLLHYRTNPYRFPIPMLDLQRAIRYLRNHSDKFGIDISKIYLLGFSAGAYAVSSFVNKFMGEDNFTADYHKDSIDKVSDYVSKVGLIYPQLSFNYHVPMLSSVLNKNDFNTDEKIKTILKELDLSKNINSNNTKQFIAYSNKDETIPQVSVENYIKEAKNKGVDITRVFIPNEKHGFSDELYINQFIKWINE